MPLEEAPILLKILVLTYQSGQLPARPINQQRVRMPSQLSVV